MTCIDNNSLEIGAKKTWEKPEISELKTSLTEKVGGKTVTSTEGAFSRPS
ncbi:MAG: hypothetical protein PHC94_00855 [Methylobacter sp.]|nr:hypothetical protein [Methylococcales bacterium]MDD5112537.1 hypothetical protein [Methylobacter sp.]